LRAIRSIRAKSDAPERRRKPLAEKILHKLLGMLNAALRLSLRARATRCNVARGARLQTADGLKSLISSAFSTMQI
jgi:hypothetical protein